MSTENGISLRSELINGEKIIGMRTLAEGSEVLYNFIKNNTVTDGITLFITHDSLIAFFNTYYNKKKHSKDNWIDYLDGVVLNF